MDTHLSHYGVKGMKWGIRRNSTRSEKSKERKKDALTEQEKESRRNDVKKRRTLSDSYIKNRIERLKLEKQFKDLTEEDLKPGRKLVLDALKSAGTKTLTTVAAGAAAYAVKAALTRRFDLTEAAGYIAANPNKKK